MPQSARLARAGNFLGKRGYTPQPGYTTNIGLFSQIGNAWQTAQPQPAPPGDDRRLGSRATNHPFDQSADADGGQVDRAMGPADGHREQRRGWDRLLSHGHLEFGGDDEGRM